MAQPELDWDHVRIFLAVMRSASLRQAAERLGVSHPTIRRRLESLEAKLGLRLFDRRNDGLHATPEAAELVELAEQVERSVNALGRRAMSADTELRGSIRVTVPEALATDLLMADFVAFAARWPLIELEVEPSYALVDLSTREADVAIRAMPIGRSPHGDLTGRLAATASSAVYGKDHQWIGWWGEERDRAWIAKTEFPDLPTCGRFDNYAIQRTACVEGMGLSKLPCFFAEPHLTPITAPKPDFDIWVLVHPDLRRSPRLRIFRDEMVAALKRLKPRLEGSAPRETSGESR